MDPAQLALPLLTIAGYCFGVLAAQDTRGLLRHV
jgi:hypothetical protein